MKKNLTKEEKSSIGRRNRSRGFAFERRIAKKFQEFWKPEDENVKFMRTAGSGGSQWKNSHNMAGDITCTDENFPLHLELKNSVAWKDFQQCLTSPKWVFWEYIEQAEKDCPKDKIPVVVMTQPGSGTKTFICGRTKDRLFTDRINKSNYNFPIILFAAEQREQCWAIELDTFLTYCRDMLSKL